MFNSKYIKKICVLFCALLFSCFLIFTASAEETADYNGASQALAEALKEGKSSVSIEKYNIPADKVNFLFQFSQCENIDIFWFPNSISYTYNSNDTHIDVLTWENIFDDFSEIEKMREEFQQCAHNAISVCFSRNMTDFEKIVSAHDFLTETSKYVFSDNYSHTAYSVFVRREGVCQGYSYAFKYLMDAVGIECHFVTSITLNHGWNIVKLDGKYYHVDVTNDDAEMKYDGVVIEHGRESHEKLLCSDKKFDVGVSDVEIWTADSVPVCDSEIYDNAFFRNVKGSMEFIDGKWYYVEPNKYINGSNAILVTYGDKTETFIEMKDPVFSVVSYGDALYIAAGNTIYRSDTKGKYEEFCFTVGEIFGCSVYEDTLFYGVYKKKNYSVCSRFLPKNVDCIEGMNMTVGADDLTCSFYIRPCAELDGGFIKYSFGGVEKEIPISSFYEKRVLDIPIPFSKIKEEIILTVSCDGITKEYKASPEKYLKIFSEADSKSEYFDVVTSLLVYAGVYEFDHEINIPDEYKAAVNDTSDKVSYEGVDITVGDDVTLKLKFTSIGKIEFSSNAKIKVETEGLYYYVTISDISPYKFDKMYTVATDGVFVRFSVFGFIADCKDEATKKSLYSYYEYCMAIKNFRKQ